VNRHQITKGNVLISSTLKFKSVLASTLLVLGLATSPVQASHYHRAIAPLAAVAALTYLFNQGHHHSAYKSRSYRSYGYSNNTQHHRYQQKNRRKHSHSSGGFRHKSRNHYQH
jgi:hypothetical protein